VRLFTWLPSLNVSASDQKLGNYVYLFCLIFLFSIVDLTAEILELAGNAARDNKKVSHTFVDFIFNDPSAY
jgi:hypothetical protein